MGQKNGSKIEFFQEQLRNINTFYNRKNRRWGNIANVTQIADIFHFIGFRQFKWPKSYHKILNDISEALRSRTFQGRGCIYYQVKNRFFRRKNM